MSERRRSKTVTQSTRLLGEFVRERRSANRMTQLQLGELAGTGTRVISDIENGKPTLRMDAVNAVLAVFGKMLGVRDIPPVRED